MNHAGELRGSVDDPDYWISCTCGWESNSHLNTNDASLEFADHLDYQMKLEAQR